MNIKHFFLGQAFALGCFAANAADDPVVLTIDGSPVYKSEFEYVYNKNNSAAALEKKSVNEYLDLFINYKLKVLQAKEEGYDDNANFIKEYEQYRKQLATPFIIDADSKNGLVREAYDRLKKQVSCSHILISFDSKNSLPPYVQISKIYDELQKGANFAELAKKYSDCPSGKREGGYLGYVNCFDMVYDFENEIFKLKPGQYSKPFKSRFGYHIVSVSDVRQNLNKRKVSQIFISDATPNAENKIDSLMTLASRNGVNFNKLALENSQGQFGGTQDGQLPWIGKKENFMPPEILAAIAEMEKVGELKKVHSRVGWHAFRLDSTNLDVPFESAKEEIEKRVLQSDRAALINSAFMAKLQDRYAVSVDSSSLADFYNLARDREDLKLDIEYGKLDKPLFVISDETFPQSDFKSEFDHYRQIWNAVLQKRSTDVQWKEYGKFSSDKQFVDYVFNRYINEKLMEKAYSDLEASNPDFRNLLHEYSDGLLLFDISNQKIWSVASKDYDGLEEFFNAHKDSYKWTEPRFRGKVIYCKDSKVKKKVAKFYSKHQSLPADSLDAALKREFNKDKKNHQIVIKNGLFAKGANKAVDYQIFKVGKTYEVERESFPEYLIYGFETKEPESFREVRGAVVADYQNKMDADWIESLREEHAVVVNYDVLKTIK